MIHVKYGTEGESSIVNSKCQTAVLMHHIAKAQGSVPVSALDLVPLQGPDIVKNAIPVAVYERGETVYANTYLTTRGTYVVVKTHEDEEGVREYEVLWRSTTGDEHDKLALALEARTADERKRGGKAKPKK